MDTHTILILGAAPAALAALFWLKRADIGRAEAHRLVAAGATLVDVRSAREFAGGHVAGAVNVPVGEIAARAAELVAGGHPIIVYCASGARSALAKRALERAGAASVFNLGSMRNW